MEVKHSLAIQKTLLWPAYHIAILSACCHGLSTNLRLHKPRANLCFDIVFDQASVFLTHTLHRNPCTLLHKGGGDLKKYVYMIPALQE